MRTSHSRRSGLRLSFIEAAYSGVYVADPFLHHRTYPQTTRKRFLWLPLGCLRTPISSIFDRAIHHRDQLVHRCLLLQSTASPLIMSLMDFHGALGWKSFPDLHGIIVTPTIKISCYGDLQDMLNRFQSPELLLNNSSLPSHQFTRFPIWRHTLSCGYLFHHILLPGQHEDLSRESFSLWC